jgi:hypothetical protein
MSSAGLPVAVLLFKACSYTTAVLASFMRPSHPGRRGLLLHAFPLLTLLLTSCLTFALLQRGDSPTPVCITAFTGFGEDTGRAAFRMFPGCFLGRQIK